MPVVALMALGVQAVAAVYGVAEDPDATMPDRSVDHSTMLLSGRRMLFLVQGCRLCSRVGVWVCPGLPHL